MTMTNIRCWIEAMRLRTLPVSLAGVVAASGYALMAHSFNPTVFTLCLLFATLAQISSNFANEYYDFRDGLDKKGRTGPRRGVTEGDITPQAMRRATFVTLGAACAVGLSLIAWGGWWLIAAGVAIAAGVIAYSAGPYPLSRHGLGEVAVIFFFGIIPVNLTYYLQSGVVFDPWVAAGSVSIGLMGANVLIVNNYRDADADASVGKMTLAVKIGRRAIGRIYLINGYVAVALMVPLWEFFAAWTWLVPAFYLVAHTFVWIKLTTVSGRSLNPLLGMTAMLMAIYAVGLTVAAAAV